MWMKDFDQGEEGKGGSGYGAGTEGDGEAGEAACINSIWLRAEPPWVDMLPPPCTCRLTGS